MADEIRVFDVGAGFVFAGFRDVFVAVWRAAPALPAVTRLSRELSAFAGEHPGGVSIVVVLEPDCGVPDGHVRVAMARSMKELDSVTRRTAVVHDGQGFWASTVRSVVVGILALARRASPITVVTTAAEAAAWIARATSMPAADAAELTRAITLARSIGAPRGEHVSR